MAFHRRAKGRTQPKRDGSMNKLETAYAAVLEQKRQAGEILWWSFEGIKLRLADRTFYTPDFDVMLPDGELQFHETKGKWEEDARVKIKVAAECYWMYRFIALKQVAKKHGGGWAIEEF